jgi:hypothetical protein
LGRVCAEKSQVLITKQPESPYAHRADGDGEGRQNHNAARLIEARQNRPMEVTTDLGSQIPQQERFQPPA